MSNYEFCKIKRWCLQFYANIVIQAGEPGVANVYNIIHIYSHCLPALAYSIMLFDEFPGIARGNSKKKFNFYSLLPQGSFPQNILANFVQPASYS